ncbi:MAG: class I SAM-dependent methyltransferase [Armatimonadota bacterium]|nr:class I SAM-dependent methyltransferase [Armatimonadota bacterium]
MSSREQFTSDVASYDAWYRTPWGAYAEEREHQLLMAMARPRAGERAADVGCGTGRLVARLLEHGVNALGVEPDAEMRTVTVRRLAQLGHRERTVAASAEELPFAGGSFDLVTAITVLEFVDDPGAAVREMARVCRDRLLIGALNRRSAYGASIARGEMGDTLSRAHLFTVDELMGLVRSHARPRRARWRTTLIGSNTGDPVELAVQRRLDDLLWRRHCPAGAFIGVLAEV